MKLKTSYTGNCSTNDCIPFAPMAISIAYSGNDDTDCVPFIPISGSSSSNCNCPTSGTSTGSGSTGTCSCKTSLKGQVGLGGQYDPIAGITTFQHSLLMGLGGTDERIRIFVDDVSMSNWGQNASFSYNKTSGLITWTNGYTWQTGSSFEVPLNQ